MRRASSLLLTGVAFGLAVAMAQPAAAQANQMIGCLSRGADGALHLSIAASGTTYSLSGDLPQLAQHVNQLVAISGAASADKLDVQQLRILSESCTSAYPAEPIEPVEGKTAASAIARPVTTTASVGETTPGFQTEAARQQEAEKSAKAAQFGPARAAQPPYAPVRPGQAGESLEAGDIAGAAAIRAEMYPGSTLGVNEKSAPPSSVRSQEETRAAR